MGNLSTMLLFLLPAAIALVGLIRKPRIAFLMMAAGIMWMSFSMLFFVDSTGVGDFRFTLAWISIALGIAFILAPFTWATGEEEDMSARERLEERQAQAKLDTLDEAEEKGTPYGEELRRWEKDSGLRPRGGRREE